MIRNTLYIFMEKIYFFLLFAFTSFDIWDGIARKPYCLPYILLFHLKFSRKFFSDRLNVVIGGKVSSDNNNAVHKESGAYIDDVSLEWRLDNGGTQYVRLFHERDYSNLVEGEIDKNGAGILLRRKVDKLSDLLIWRKKEENVRETQQQDTK